MNERYELHAGMDVSDGLAIDLARLVRESGVGAVVETDRVPIHDDARRMARQAGDGRTPLEHALGDGEDFELLLAVPPDEARRMLAEQPLGAADRHRPVHRRAGPLAAGGRQPATAVDADGLGA